MDEPDKNKKLQSTGFSTVSLSFNKHGTFSECFLGNFANLFKTI